MTTNVVSSICCSEGPPPSSGKFRKSAGETSEIFQAISSSRSSLTPFTKRKVSFDESGGTSNNDLDVTSRFLTSQYTTTSLEASFPSSSRKTCCCLNLCNDTTAQVYWDSGSRNNAAASSRKTKSSHDITPSCKPTVTSRLSSLSRSGCLCLLDGDTSAKRRRSIKGSAIPSVSEDDMTVDSSLLEVRLENEHTMMDDDDHVVASVSVLPSMSQVQLQVQLQLQLEEEKSDSSDDHDDKCIDQPPSHYWGHFVDFLSPGPEESKACKYKRRNTNQRTRYRPYHSKTPTSAKQSFPFRVSSKTDHVYAKDDTFLQSNTTDDEEISRAIERISL